MKNTFSSIKKHLLLKYTYEDESLNNKKSTNINVLLNRIKLDKKSEKRKKIYFSAAASTGLILFGLIIF